MAKSLIICILLDPEILIPVTVIFRLEIGAKVILLLSSKSSRLLLTSLPISVDSGPCDKLSHEIFAGLEFVFAAWIALSDGKELNLNMGG